MLLYVLLVFIINDNNNNDINNNKVHLLYQFQTRLPTSAENMR